jgi:hypothetical protein
MEFFKDMAMKSAVCKPSLWLNTWMTLLSSGNIVLRLSTVFYIISIIQGPLSNLLRKQALMDISHFGYFSYEERRLFNNYSTWVNYSNSKIPSLQF